MEKDYSDIFDFYDEQHSYSKELEEVFVSKEHSDAKLKVGDKIFHVHKVILSMSSPVFRVLFSKRWTEGDTYEIGTELIDPEIVNDLLSYIYTGKVIFTLFNAHSICVAAHYLDFSRLLVASEQYLGGRLLISNVCSFFKISLTRGLKILQKSVFDFVKLNHRKIFQSSEILTLSFDELKVLFKGICTKDDETLKLSQFYLVSRWMRENIEERENSIENLFNLIPIWDLSKRLLTTKVALDPIFWRSHICSKYLNKIFLDLLREDDKPTIERSHKLFYFNRYVKYEINSFIHLGFYDLKTKKWTSIGMNSFHKFEFAVSNIESDIYVAGGITKDGEKLTTFDKFSDSKNRWISLESLPFDREQFAMTTLDGYIYVSGGQDCSTSKASSDLVRYCPLTNQWHSMASMNEPRTNHRMLVTNLFLFAIGGEDRKTVEKYNPLTNEWVYVKPMDRSFKTFDATVFRGDIYVYNNSGLLKYSPNIDVWSILKTPVNEPEQVKIVDESKLLVFEGKLFLMNCRKPQDPLTSSYEMLEYNFTSNTFKRCPDMDIKKKFQCPVGFYQHISSSQ